MKRLPRLPFFADFILFIALCISTAYWGIQLFKPQVRQVAASPQVETVAPRIEAAAILFGGRPSGVMAASNFQLKGVIAAGPSGVAILSADGKPLQAVGVAQEVAPGVTVKEVHSQYVLLNEGGVIKRVDLPEAAKGSGDFGGAGAAPPTVQAPMPAPVMTVNNGQSSPLTILPPPPIPQPMVPEAPEPGAIPGGGHPGLKQ